MVAHGVVLGHVVSTKGIRQTKEKLILFSLCLTPNLLDRSDPLYRILNFITDLSKVFLKLLLLFAIHLLRMIFTVMKTI